MPPKAKRGRPKKIKDPDEIIKVKKPRGRPKLDLSKIDQDDLKIYCGSAEKPPVGHRFGSMKECADAKAVRRYGILKIDRRTLNASLAKTTGPSRLSLLKKLTSTRGKNTKLNRDLLLKSNKDNKKNKDIINKQINDNLIIIKSLSSQIQNIK